MPWIFGPSFGGHSTTVELKELKKFDAPTRAKAFKARCDAFYVKQVDVIGARNVWSPFPLAVMTCIGIEMVGSYKYGDALGDRNGHFRKLVEDMDARFARKEVAPDGKEQPLSSFIYKGFRNSLAHGFYGHWVFITHDEKKAKTFRYSKSRGFVVLNVYWFYRRFKEIYEEFFTRLLTATDSSLDPLKTFNSTFEKNFKIWV